MDTVSRDTKRIEFLIIQSWRDNAMTSKRRHGRSKRNNVASVRVEGNFLSVESPAAISILESGLTCRRRSPRRADRNDTDVELWQFTRRRDDKLMVPAPLLQRTDRLLRSHGLVPKLSGSRSLRPRMSPNFKVAAGITSRGRAALEAIRNFRHAQLPIAGDSQALKIAKEIVAAFAEARILFVIRQGNAARRVAGELARSSQRPIRRLWKHRKWSSVPRPTIGVGTANHLAQRTGPWDWDVIVLWESRIALSRAVADALFYRDLERFIGFARTHDRPVADEAMRIEAVLGPIVGEGRLMEEQDRVQVVLEPYGGSPAPWRDAAEGYAFKKRLWQSTERNRFIATIAEETVQRLPMPVADDAPDQSRDMRLAIVVESPLHARHLGRLLKDWPIATAETSHKDELGDRFITTASFAAKVGIPVDVIIRADAGMLTLDPSRYRMIRENIHKERPLDLIDIADVHDPRLHRRTTQYRRNGWQIVNDTSSPSRHDPESQSHPTRIINWMATVCPSVRQWQSTEQQEAQRHRPNANPATMPPAQYGHQASSRPR